MNCVKVQEAIWCGELTYDMQQHIATCEDCQKEQAKIQSLHFSLEHVSVPTQSRSLLPSKQEIEQTMRTRKRHLFTKWGIGGVAAAACVLAAVMVVPTFLHPANSPTTSGATPPQKTLSTPASLEDRTDPTLKSKKPASPNPASTDPSVTPAQPYVTVDAGVDSKYIEQENAIQDALSQGFDTSLFQHITIEKMIQDAQHSDGNNLSFVVTLGVQHQPGKKSAYGEGDVYATRFAHFTNTQGTWKYDGLATSPTSLPSSGQTNDWREVDVKNNNATVATFKVPAFLEAQSSNIGSVTLNNQGKQMGMLEVENQNPHNAGDYSHAAMLPNHGTVASQQISTNNNGVHVVLYTLQYDPPAASGGQSTLGTRVYFMRDDKVAYDLSFPDGAISADNLKQIIDGFDIIATP